LLQLKKILSRLASYTIKRSKFCQKGDCEVVCSFFFLLLSFLHWLARRNEKKEEKKNRPFSSFIFVYHSISLSLSLLAKQESLSQSKEGIEMRYSEIQEKSEQFFFNLKKKKRETIFLSNRRRRRKKTTTTSTHSPDDPFLSFQNSRRSLTSAALRWQPRFQRRRRRQ
jgi:hypothetical protein